MGITNLEMTGVSYIFFQTLIEVYNLQKVGVSYICFLNNHKHVSFRRKKGGFAIVYQCKHRLDESLYAVKKISFNDQQLEQKLR